MVQKTRTSITLVASLLVSTALCAMVRDSGIWPQGLSPNHPEIASSGSDLITVTMTGVGSSDTVVNLSQSPARLGMPSTVVVPEGQSSASFLVTNPPGGPTENVSISATANGTEADTSVTAD